MVLAFSTSAPYGQGTFIYDQQSDTNETVPGGGSPIQQGSPLIGQGFTPTLPGIDFIRLKLTDANWTNGLGATVFVNLRSGSIGGSIIASTAPVTFADAFTGTPNFLFSATVPLTPGTTYYFQPVVQSGDLWRALVSEFNYPGGIAWSQGIGLPGADFWFREGIIIPEPSSAALLTLLGGSLLIYVRSIRTRG
jgi:hypothetical protein